MSELFDYYWRVLRRAFGLAFSWNRDSFMNFIPVILVLLFEVNRGWLDAGKFAHEAGAQTLLVVLALMTYFIPALAWAPVALDRERAEKTEKLVARLGGEVSVTFKSLRFEHPVPDQRITRVRIDVAFRTSDVPATLGSWALRSEKAPAISPVCSHIWGFNDRLGAGSFRLEAHDHQSGAFVFDFVGMAQATEDEIKDPLHHWVLEFTDAHRTYAEPIRAELFGK